MSVSMAMSRQFQFIERIVNNTLNALNALTIENRAVFSCPMKESKLIAGSRTLSGSEFQVAGVPTKNVLLQCK